MSIYSERELLSQGDDVDSTLMSEGVAKSDEAAANIHHSKAAFAALLLKLASGEAVVVLVQEPWINIDRICGLGSPTYSLFHASGKGKPWACSLVKKQLIAFCLTQFSEGDITTLTLETDERSMVICFFYLAHDHPGPKLVSVISNLVRDYAIGDIILGCDGDANEHHVIWGNSDINVRAELLYDYILSNNIYACNKGNDPTFFIKNRSEVLDITLASSTLIQQVSSWSVLDEY